MRCLFMAAMPIPWNFRTTYRSVIKSCIPKNVVPHNQRTHGVGKPPRKNTVSSAIQGLVIHPIFFVYIFVDIRYLRWPLHLVIRKSCLSSWILLSDGVRNSFPKKKGEVKQRHDSKFTENMMFIGKQTAETPCHQGCNMIDIPFWNTRASMFRFSIAVHFRTGVEDHGSSNPASDGLKIHQSASPFDPQVPPAIIKLI